MKFSELGLHPKILSRLEKIGFEKPTPIQQKAIPVALQGRDIIGCAQTGTGKTAAFGLPILDAIARGEAKERRPYALILAPTRELAEQIRQSLDELAPEPIKLVSLLGGMAMAPQIKGLREGAAIIVATPGRLLDHLERRTADLSPIGFFVLDEADRMLDMGFIPQVERILGYLPHERQSMMFSATLPVSLGSIEHRTLRSPFRVDVAPSGQTAEGIEQHAYPVDQRSKLELLEHLLNQVDGPTLIFTRTKEDADKLARVLGKREYAVRAMHGDLSQKDRNKALEEFREGKCRILVATDVASRGLDVEGIAHVINYDMPSDPESYVHRIGRTGRAGSVGRSSLFVSFGEGEDLKRIENLTGEKIPEGEIPPGTLTHTSLAPALGVKVSRGGRARTRRYV